MEMKIVAISVSVVVSVILLAGVLMPVIEDASSDVKYSNELSTSITYKNELIKPANTSITVEIDPTNSLIKIGTTEYPINSEHNAYIITDGGYFRFWDNSGFMTGYAGGTATSQATNRTAGTITIENGLITYVSGDVEISWQSSQFILLPNVNGNYYVRTANDGPQYVNDIGDIYVSSIVNNRLVWGNGNTLTDGSNTYEAVLTSDATLVDGTVNVYSLTNMKTYRMMENGTGYYPAFVCVPTEIEGTSEGWENISSLLAVFPILIIVSILVGVLVIFTRRS